MEQTKQQETEDTTVEKVADQDYNAATNAQAVKAATSGGIGYSGTIRVTIKRGKHTVSSKIYHNTGTPKLFAFMANVLAGQYSIVSSKRPQRLMLFKLSEESGASGKTAALCLSGPIVYSTTPYVQELKTEPEAAGAVPETIGSAVILHFVVPGTLFSQNTYDGAALYDATSNPSLIEGTTSTNWPDPNCCAYFTFGVAETLTALTVNEGETAIIDWQMNFQNLQREEGV